MWNEDCLMHYGVVGMKWGVRRYQNEDGSLTKAGYKRVSKINSSERLQRKETKRAVKALSKASKFLTDNSKWHEKKANKYLMKSVKYNDKNETEKASKYAFKSMGHKITSGQYSAYAKYLNGRIDEINSGVVKAGRDFLTAKAPYSEGIYGKYEYIDIKKS